MHNIATDDFMQHYFFAVFACIWMAVTAGLSMFGGWFSLSHDFRATSSNPGTRFRFVSGSMGAGAFPVTSYGGCLFLTISDAGFRLSILFVFRPLSPPLFIPWSAVASVESKRLLFVPYTVIRLRRGWPTIAFRGAAGRCIESTFARVSAKEPPQLTT
jgi:hypothetical protein